MVEKYGIQKVYADFQEMFIDPEVDIIYIATPHNKHFEFMKQALEKWETYSGREIYHSQQCRT